MARTTATVSFQAIELKGSLLPGSLLEQVARLQAPMQKEADYGLAKGERLRERIDAAWVRLKEIWEEYKDLRERAAQSTAGLHASARILREVLGWPDLQPCSGWQHGGSQFPITHRAFEAAVPLILRGIASDQLDKGSSQFGQEGRRRSPHSCLQECLNADDNANWGLLLTGDRLRLLHDNPSLVKPAYLAVDLELLVEGELFDEFAVLWLLLHASRFRHPQMGSCVLDTWKEQAQEAGERVLGQLRNGVQQALEALGNGLLQHPENEALRNQLASGALSGQELHRQLLRLVYRFLFLFTAEDRDLLFPRTLGQEDPRRRIYREGYSVGRLRELAIRRSASEGPYGDLWQTQKLVFLQLRQSSSPLGLPGLGGLFAEPQCRALEQCELANRFLLRAIRAIGWFQAGDTLTRVNYRDLNTEELGSVYEGLLELHPQLERAGGSWQLSYGGGAGSDRKTTGSYYTPDQLVQLLIVSALLPVIADRLSKASTPEEKEQALLAIRVLDPACGSGHFLLAAARRLALELARIRAGDEEPSEELRQECLREVVAHCIYGVDKNPMAVELCKVALWIEAVDPGKPLSFLDAHIQCGDSLVGVFDPRVLEQGIPDEAYKPLTGDDKPTCTSLKKENASFRKAGQKGTLQGTLNLQSTPPISRSQQRLQEIEAMPETTLAEGSAKQAAYEAWEQERSSDPETLAADLYTAAFFLPKTQASRSKVPTSEHMLLLQSGQEIPGDLELAVEQAARDFRFFHWHLRFGEVMEKGGFDCVLGNPPWERIKLQEKEWFSKYDSAIAEAKNASNRKRLIASLSGANPELEALYKKDLRRTEAESMFIRNANRNPLCGRGDINLYSIFAETSFTLLTRKGRSGLVLQSGIASDETTSLFYQMLSQGGHLISLYDFENKELIFPDIAPVIKFCLLTLEKNRKTSDKESLYLFLARDVNEIGDADRHFTLSNADLELFNPNTRTCPIFRSRTDCELSRAIYRQLPILLPTDKSVAATRGSGWNIEFETMFHLSGDSGFFKTLEELTESGYSLNGNKFNSQSSGCGYSSYLPLYEAKLFNQFNYRENTFDGIPLKDRFKVKAPTRKSTESELANPFYSNLPRYWVAETDVKKKAKYDRTWLLAFRDMTNIMTNARNAIFAIMPQCAIGHSAPIIHLANATEAALMCAIGNSFIFDYCVRQMLAGSHLTYFILKQLPVPSRIELLEPCPMNQDISWQEYILKRATKLICTSIWLREYAGEISESLEISPCSFEEQKALRYELDATMFYLYFKPTSKGHWDSELNFNPEGMAHAPSRLIATPRSAIEYVMNSFTIVKRKDISSYGEYVTLTGILEAWDRLFGGR